MKNKERSKYASELGKKSWKGRKKTPSNISARLLLEEGRIDGKKGESRIQCNDYIRRRLI
jgi:hypothetical protein